MEFVRQDSSRKTQEYDFHVADRTGWNFIYHEFDYPSEEDKPKGAVKASLVIQERCPNNFPSQSDSSLTGYFNEVVYLGFDGDTSRMSDELGYSAVISKIKKLEEKEKSELFDRLSIEARSLLEKGLEGYTGIIY
jgi:hypothetical protein